MIAAEHGNGARAIELVGRATGLDPAQPAWLAQLGRLHLARHDPSSALQAARQGLALQPRDAPTLDTLATVLSRAGTHREALEPFRQAVALEPARAAYWFNLGTAEQFCGDFTAAAAAFRSTLALEPRHFKALSALAEVASGGLDDTEVARVEATLARPDLAVDEELHLCHVLARVRERSGREEEAMQLLARGKRRRLTQPARQSGDDEALVAAVLRTCNAGFLGHDDGHDDRAPLFIVGMPRSGTTLVERILSSHPQVTSAGELMHFSLAVKQVAGTSSPLVLDVPTLEAAPGLDYGRVGRLYAEATRPLAGGTRHFVDKMPLNFLYAGMIHRALPRARIICLRRGAADTCLANYRQLFATGFPYYDYALDLAHTARFVCGFEALANHWRNTLGKSWLEVRYEEVVADLEGQARRLLAFCGLDWDPACLQFHRNAAPVATASSVQVRNPLYTTAVGRWRRYRPGIDAALAVLEERGIRLD